MPVEHPATWARVLSIRRGSLPANAAFQTLIMLNICHSDVLNTLQDLYHANYTLAESPPEQRSNLVPLAIVKLLLVSDSSCISRARLRGVRGRDGERLPVSRLSPLRSCRLACMVDMHGILNFKRGV